MIVEIEKMIFGGQGLTRLPTGQVVLVWNALPGEKVKIELIKQRRGVALAVAREVITASVERIQPVEPEIFLATSPWQTMSWETELEWKRRIAAETYGKLGGVSLTPDDLTIESDGQMYGYRNKMEFSFAEQNGQISLAFFDRGSRRKIPVGGSALAHPLINQSAADLLDWIRRQSIPLRSLKSLIIRNNGTQTIAGLFIKDPMTFATYPETTATLSGFSVFYSTHQSPASVPTALLYQAGEEVIAQTILETKLQHGLLSFFQINRPVFEYAVRDLAAAIDAERPLLDYYAGVGTIGLAATKNPQTVSLIEEQAEAVAFAQKNIAANQRVNCLALCAPAERLREAITRDTTVVVDPPRVGLHHKLIERILTVKPRYLLYLSCGIDTQARDIKLLSPAYQVKLLKLYNFFPRTPHIEALGVLERKD